MNLTGDAVAFNGGWRGVGRTFGIFTKEWVCVLLASVSGGQEPHNTPCSAQESHPLSLRKIIQPQMFVVLRLRTLTHRPY